MEVVLPRPLSDGEIAALRTLPLNVSRQFELRDVTRILGGNVNVFGVIAMLRLVKDCPRRVQTLSALRMGFCF